MPSQLSILLLALLISLFSCGKEQTVDDMATYDGPALEADNVETLYSDSAVLRVRLKAPKQLELQNGNREFPKGLYVEFFDEKGKKSSTLKSDRGTYRKEENLYVVKGNAIVENLVEQQSLHTEELFWDPETQKVYTDKKVRIVGPEQILLGIGLEANQDFSLYKIKQPTGSFPVEE